MPSRSCYVPGCKSGYASNIRKARQAGQNIPSLFHPPEHMVQLWDSIIQRKDRNLHQCDLVCSLHFKEEDIERYYTHIIDGQVVQIERGNPKLRKGAVPSVFSYDNLKGLRATRRSRALAQQRSLELNTPLVKKKRKLTAGDYAVETSTDFRKRVTRSRHHRASIQIKEAQNSDSEERPNSAFTEGMKSPLFEVFNTSDHCRSELYDLLARNKTEASAEIKKTLLCRSDFEFPISLVEETSKITGNRIPETMPCRPKEPNEVSAFTYNELLEYAYVIPLPSSLWAVHKQPHDKYVAFVHMTYSTADGFKTDRGVVFEGTCEPVIFFYSHKVHLPQLEKKVTCVGDVSNLLQEVDEFHAVCLFVDCVK